VTIMLALFERLETVEQRDEEKKLNIIRKNSSPYYTDKLALTRVYSIDELRELEKQIEVSMYRMALYGVDKEKQKMEPEFAIKSTCKQKRISINEIQPTTSRDDGESRSSASRGKAGGCWKCGSLDHRFQNCPEKQTRKFCYKCGNIDYTVKTCPKCNTNANPRERVT